MTTETDRIDIGTNVGNLTDLAAWIDRHADHETRPLDAIMGIVDVIEPETGPSVTLATGTDPRVRTLDYSPTGWTDVAWDTASTIGIGCLECASDQYVREWIGELFPAGTVPVEPPLDQTYTGPEERNTAA